MVHSKLNHITNQLQLAFILCKIVSLLLIIKYLLFVVYLIDCLKFAVIVTLQEKIQLINNFYFKLDHPLYVLYEVYGVCVLNILNNRLIYHGPRKPKLYISLPFIKQLSCNEIKRVTRVLL